MLGQGLLEAQDYPRPPLPPFPERIVNSWRFDGPEWLTEAGSAPMVALGVDFVPSWSGHALCVAGSGPALFAVAQMAKDGTLNLPMNGSGAIRFWFAPSWSSHPAIPGGGPGAPVPLLELGTWTSNDAQTEWSLGIDPDGSRVWLRGMAGGKVIEVLSAPIAWLADQWHQVALTWTKDGTVGLYLDGGLAAKGSGFSLASVGPQNATRGFCLGSNVHGQQLAQGQFEEVSTFGWQLTDDELLLDYERCASRSELGPVSKAEDELAMALLSATQASTLSGVVTQFDRGSSIYACNLWLEISQPSEGSVTVTIHNTINGVTYQLWSKEDLGSENWTPEGEPEVGPSGTDFIPVEVSMGSRTNLFFKVSSEEIFSVEASFAGMFEDHLNVFNVGAPPDTMGAVGPNHVVELLNDTVAIYSKSGTLLQGPADSSQTVFTNATIAASRALDPRILYDHWAGRWIATAMDISPDNPYEVILAISSGSELNDLESDWTSYRLNLAIPDYNTDVPTLGLDSNGIYISVLQRGIGPGNNDTRTTIAAIDKAAVYAGGNPLNNMATFEFLFSTLDTYMVQPAVNYDSVGEDGYAWFIAKGQDGTDPGTGAYLGGAIKYRRLKKTSGSEKFAWHDSTWLELPNSAMQYRNYLDFDVLPSQGHSLIVVPPQVGIATQFSLNNPGSRLTMAFLRDGFLWTCHQVGLNENGTYAGNGDLTAGGYRSGLQWFKFSTTGTSDPLAIVKMGRVYDGASTTPWWYYCPSFAVSKCGDMVIGFSGSSEVQHVGAYFTGIPDISSQAESVQLIREGEGIYSASRWGDYSYTILDPVDDSIWTFQEYAKPPIEEPETPPTSVWGTWISRIIPLF